jgi:hypothetical protein
MAVAWLGQYHRTFRVTGPMNNASAGESGQRTALRTPNNALANGHPRDPGSAELSRRYYGRRLRSLSFPGKRPCWLRSCCLHTSAVWRNGESAASRSGWQGAARSRSDLRGNAALTANG